MRENIRNQKQLDFFATCECMFVSGKEAGKALSLCVDLQCIVCHTTSKDDHQVSKHWLVSFKLVDHYRKILISFLPA